VHFVLEDQYIISWKIFRLTYQFVTYFLLCLADLAALVLETIANNTVVLAEDEIVLLMSAVLKDIRNGSHEARAAVALVPGVTSKLAIWSYVCTRKCFY